jgi:hypothetical protein
MCDPAISDIVRTPIVCGRCAAGWPRNGSEFVGSDRKFVKNERLPREKFANASCVGRQIRLRRRSRLCQRNSRIRPARGHAAEKFQARFVTASAVTNRLVQRADARPAIAVTNVVMRCSVFVTVSESGCGATRWPVRSNVGCRHATGRRPAAPLKRIAIQQIPAKPRP